MAVLHRVRQFALALTAWLRPGEGAEAMVAAWLPAPAVDLFRAMPRYDRRHALGVFRTLQRRGYGDRDLLAAALLHDVGKAAHAEGGLRLWHRVAVVLLQTVRPGFLAEAGRDLPRGWRRPFAVQQRHAEIGAELARQAGCSPRTAGWILHHEDRACAAADPLLAALQAADDEN